MASAVFNKNKLIIIAMVVLSVLTAAMFVIPAGIAEAAPIDTPQEGYSDAELLSEEIPSQPAAEGQEDVKAVGTILMQKYKVTAGQPYYLTFKHKAYTDGDEMNVFFQPEGEPASALATVRSNSAEWVEDTYKVVPEDDVMELSFETLNAQSGDISMGTQVQGVQLRAVARVMIDMTVEPESTSEQKPYVRDKNRMVKYRLKVENVGGNNAQNVVLEIPFVDGLYASSFTITDAATNQPVKYKESNNTIVFQGGSNPSANDFTGGTIEVGKTYEYFIEFKVSGRKLSSTSYINSGDTVKASATVKYKDGGLDYINKSNADNAAFTYGVRGVSGMVYRDRNRNHKYDKGIDTTFASTDSNIGVALVDMSGKQVYDPDGNPYFKTLESYQNGEYEFVGVAPGQYQIKFQDVPGLMPSEVSSEPGGNKAGLTSDRLFSIINVDLSSTGMISDQNIGLVESYDLSYVTATNGSTIFKTTNMSDRAIADYNNTVESKLVINTKGYHINTPVEIFILVPPGTDILTHTAGAAISPTSDKGYKLTWNVNSLEGLGKIHEYSVKYRVNKRAGDEFYDSVYFRTNAQGIEETKITSYMKMSDKKGTLSLGKGIAEMREKDKVTQDETFLVRLDYMLNKDEPIEYSFYSNLVVKKGTTHVSTRMTSLEPGFYAVTELDTNWRYDLFGSTKPTYYMMVAPNMDGQITFYNDKTTDKWVDGKTNVTNQMQQLP